MLKPLPFICFLCCGSLFAATNGVIRSAAELSRAVYQGKAIGARFDFSANVVRFPQGHSDNGPKTLSIRDDSGSAALIVFRNTPCPSLTAGDRIAVSGIIDDDHYFSLISALPDKIKKIGHEAPPPPIPRTTADINLAQAVDELVSLRGVLTTVLVDEIDPKYIYLVITDGNGAAYAYIPLVNTTDDQISWLKRQIGSEVSATGICSYHPHTGRRKQISVEVHIDNINDVKILKPADDPYAVPDLHAGIRSVNPVIAGDLKPRRVSGKVLATWQGNRALIQTTDGFVSELRFAADSLPSVGDSIEAVGIPETDLFQLNLSKAIWRKASVCAVTSPPPERVTVKFMMSDEHGNREVKTHYCGRTIRISGLVQALPAVRNGDFRLNLSCDGYDVPVDFSPVPEALGKIENGSVIEVTGVCVIESENWRPQIPFPCARGFSVILRTADDVRVIERPPWWTPARFCTVIAALLLALVGFIIRNRILKRIAREKLQERTRLAVELHDSMSQNLTGATMQIDTAQKLIEKNREKATRHLAIASKTLTSCREDLRNCIWDLRNHTLETADMNEAIHQTLQQHLDGARLAVRFNVPRNLLTDNTAHALLCILRELAVNAVRHGHATQIRVAGAIDGAQLKFSVADNGCGFDPDTRPGMAEGHFGLQGIQERLKQFGGSLSISSASGQGSKFTASLALPRKDKQL